MKIDKTFKFAISSNRLFLAMTMLLLTLLMCGDMYRAFSAGKWILGSLDIVMTIGIIHQWWTVWSKQIK